MHLLMKKIHLALTLLVVVIVCAMAPLAQYVAFEDLSYNDVAERKVHARIELRRTREDKDPITTETNEHGSYDFESVSPGEYVLRITSLGYRAYETEIYLPSDFICNLGVMLKKAKPLTKP